MKILHLVDAIAGCINERVRPKRLFINPVNAVEVQSEQSEIAFWVDPARQPAPGEIGELMGVDVFASDDVPPGTIRVST